MAIFESIFHGSNNCTTDVFQEIQEHNSKHVWEAVSGIELL